MLEYFFSIEKEAQSRHLFDGLSIARADSEYVARRGQYPVIFLSLKDIKNPSWSSWERMLSFMRLYIKMNCRKYRIGMTAIVSAALKFIIPGRSSTSLTRAIAVTIGLIHPGIRFCIAYCNTVLCSRKEICMLC
nr:hypothetical protein [uncultured Megasphaera sp.]